MTVEADVRIRTWLSSLLSPAVHLVIVAAVVVPIVKMYSEGKTHPSGAFFVFAALPAVVGLLHHVSRERRRFEEGKADLEMRGGRMKASAIERFQPTAWSMLVSCLTLYAVFLVCAMLAAVLTNTDVPKEAKGGLTGLVMAGYGAYVSVLWYMLGRINANALSSRFIINSALRVAAATVIGYVAGYLGMFESLPDFWSDGGYFLMGMFQAWAMNYLREKAREIFKVKQASVEDLPLSLIQGVDESAADLLNENGISTVQHLATTDPIELSFRTLYPLDRTLDWVDQAILTVEFGATRMAMLRDAQIRSVTGFLYVHRIAIADGPNTPAALQTLKELAQKMGLGEAGLLLKGEILEQNRVVDIIEELWNKTQVGQRTLVRSESGTFMATVPAPSLVTDQPHGAS